MKKGNRPRGGGRLVTTRVDAEAFEEALGSAVSSLPVNDAEISLVYRLPSLLAWEEGYKRARCEDLRHLTPFELYLEEVLTTVALAVAMAEVRQPGWPPRPSEDIAHDAIPWLRLRLAAIRAERGRRHAKAG